MGWALARSGGNPGGMGINSQMGEKLAANRPAPHFTASSLDGTPISSRSFQGKIIMLDFWSSWCPPCRIEARTLSHVYREYSDKPVEFIGIAIWDNDEDILKFVQEFNILYPNTVDAEGRIALEYGVSGIPEKFFIDGSGILRKRFVGPMSPGALRSILDEMLANEGQEQPSNS